MRSVIKMENESKIFSTKDFYLASLLRAKDIRLIEVTKEGNLTAFHFEKKNEDELAKLITNFYNNTEMVLASRLVDSIRNLKALTYNLLK